MKIMFVAGLYPPLIQGGAERVVHLLAESMAATGHRSIVVTLSEKPGTEIETVNGVKIYRVGLANIYWPWSGKRPAPLKPLWHLIDSANRVMASRFSSILDREPDIDVIHTHHIAGFSGEIWKRASDKAPVIHTLHDYYMLCARSTMFRNGGVCDRPCLDCRGLTWRRRTQTRYLDGVTGVSRFVLERHEQEGVFAETPLKRVIYNPIPERMIEHVQRSTDGPVRFGYLGRLHHTKGLDVLLAATERMSSQDWELAIAGSGPPDYEAALRNRTRDPRISFEGFVQAEEFLATIDVLVIPSLWYENSPMSIYEAYAKGVPVIGSRRGGIPELIEDGVTGFVVEPGDEAGLAGLMDRFVDRRPPAEDLRSSCWRAAERFALPQITEAYLDAYSALRDRLKRFA